MRIILPRQARDKRRANLFDTNKRELVYSFMHAGAGRLHGPRQRCAVDRDRWAAAPEHGEQISLPDLRQRDTHGLWLEVRRRQTKSHVYQPSLSIKAMERERDSEDQRLSWQKHKEALLRTACTQHYLHLLISSFPCVLCAIWCG
jgi:hypothetical protein